MKRFRKKPKVINLGHLEKYFKKGETVSPKTLVEKNLIRLRGKKIPKIKILGGGEITKKLKIEDLEFSKSAKEKIEKVKT